MFTEILRAARSSPAARSRRLLTLLLCVHEGCATVLSPSLTGRPSREKRDYFARIGLSGALACSITHSMVVPLDVIKTRMQTDETVRGFRHAAKTILREQKGPFRARVFLNGASATAMGYYLQGGAKFGGYELLKYNIFDRIERTGGGEAVRRWRLPVMMGAAGVAEVFASVMLAPLEVTAPTATTTPHPELHIYPNFSPSPKPSPSPSPSPSPNPNPNPSPNPSPYPNQVVKLRLQTDPSAAARGLVHTFVHISRDEGLGALFQGLKPITMRQLPYTVTKLVAYELCSTTLIAASRRFVKARGDAEDAPLALLLRPAMVLLSGILAGAAAAVVSQPADVLLTRICASGAIAKCSLDAAGSFRDQLAELARGGLREAYAGIGPRLAMVSAMTSVQFLLYDWVRCQLQCDGVYATKG